MIYGGQSVSFHFHYRFIFNDMYLVLGVVLTSEESPFTVSFAFHVRRWLLEQPSVYLY